MAWKLLSVRPSSVCKLMVSQKPLHGYKPNVMESYLSTISPEHYFPSFPIFFDNFLQLVSLTWDLMGGKIQNANSPSVSVKFQPTFMINMLVMGEYRLLFLAIC